MAFQLTEDLPIKNLVVGVGNSEEAMLIRLEIKEAFSIDASNVIDFWKKTLSEVARQKNKTGEWMDAFIQKLNYSLLLLETSKPQPNT